MPVEERKDWLDYEEYEIRRRLGGFVALLAEQVTMPTLMRAATLAPGYEPGGPWDSEYWPDEVVTRLRLADQRAARDKIDALHRSTSSQSPAARRQGADPVLAFIAGAVLL